MAEKNRPVSISIISWFLIVSGCLAFLGALSLPGIYNNPQYQDLIKAQGGSLGRDLVLAIIGSAVNIISGIVMLKAINWGRYLYLWANGISFLLSFVIHKFNLLIIPSIILYIVICVFLTRKAASDFFTPKLQSRPDEAVGQG